MLPWLLANALGVVPYCIVNVSAFYLCKFDSLSRKLQKNRKILKIFVSLQLVNFPGQLEQYHL